MNSVAHHWLAQRLAAPVEFTPHMSNAASVTYTAVFRTNLSAVVSLNRKE
jgi:hypothetical protein